MLFELLIVVTMGSSNGGSLAVTHVPMQSFQACITAAQTIHKDLDPTRMQMSCIKTGD